MHLHRYLPLKKNFFNQNGVIPGSSEHVLCSGDCLIYIWQHIWVSFDFIEVQITPYTPDCPD